MLSLHKHVWNQWDTTLPITTIILHRFQTYRQCGACLLTHCYLVFRTTMTIYNLIIMCAKTHSLHTMSENIFWPNKSVAESCDSFTLTKGWYKFGNLQIYYYESNANPSSGCWTTIPHQLEVVYIASIGQLNISITGFRHKYVSSLIRYL